METKRHKQNNKVKKNNKIELNKNTQNTFVTQQKKILTKNKKQKNLQIKMTNNETKKTHKCPPKKKAPQKHHLFVALFYVLTILFFLFFLFFCPSPTNRPPPMILCDCVRVFRFNKNQKLHTQIKYVKMLHTITNTFIHVIIHHLQLYKNDFCHYNQQIQYNQHDITYHRK